MTNENKEMMKWVVILAAIAAVVFILYTAMGSKKDTDIVIDPGAGNPSMQENNKYNLAPAPAISDPGNAPTSTLNTPAPTHSLDTPAPATNTLAPTGSPDTDNQVPGTHTGTGHPTQPLDGSTVSPTGIPSGKDNGASQPDTTYTNP